MINLLILLVLLGLFLPAMAAEKTTNPSGRVQVAARTLTPAERTRLLGILNEGDGSALQSLPNIGETRAGAIKKARPIIDPVDLVKVEGIGDQTFVDIIAHAKSGFPALKAGTAKNRRPKDGKKSPAKADSAPKKS